jgi:hypothetical protein
MSASTEQSSPKPRIVSAAGITFVLGLLLGVVFALLPGWIRKPTGQQLNISNSTGASITARTEDGRSIEMEPSGENGFPQNAFLFRPGESVTFEAKIDGKVVTRTVTPLGVFGRFRADVGLSGGTIQFRYHNPE